MRLSALGSSQGESESAGKSLPRVKSAHEEEESEREPLIELVPREPALASASSAKPAAADFIVEAVQRMPVARQTVIATVPSENAAQPPMLIGQRRMHTTPLFRPHCEQLPSESLPVGPSLHDEATLSAPRAVMCEAKEGKRLRPPVTARLTKFGREPAEFDEARVVFVARQAKRGEAFPKGEHHLPRVRLVLKAHHEVVGITHEFRRWKRASPGRLPPLHLHRATWSAAGPRPPAW